jgi:hypothetical protein
MAHEKDPTLAPLAVTVPWLLPCVKPEGGLFPAPKNHKDGLSDKVGVTVIGAVTGSNWPAQ